MGLRQRGRLVARPAGLILAAAVLLASLAAATTYEPAIGNPFTGNDLAQSPWVRSGDGSAANPFVISGWERNLTNGGNGSELGSTVAYLTIRANHFFGDGVGPHTQCCRALNVFELRNFTFEDNLVEKVRMTYAMFTGYQDQRVTQENVQILRNRILNNTDAGLSIANARNFTIAANTFVGTGGPPIALRSNTAAIHVFHNNFVNSTAPPTDAAGSENAWDDGYPSGGNFWSDYNGSDRCKGPAQDDCSSPDGIGDTPYRIDADSVDRYPLMSPYEVPNQPPQAVLSIDPSSPIVNQTVTLNASASSDPEDGRSGLEFRFDLDGDGGWETGWAANASATTTLATAGERAALVEVRDSKGATSNASLTFVVVDPAAADPHPAVVIASAPRTSQIGVRIAVLAEVNDTDGVASVQIVYQGVGASSFARLSMDKINPNHYRAILPAQGAPGILEYFILVTDAGGHQTRDPAQGTHGLSVVFSGPSEETPIWASWRLDTAWVIPLVLVAATIAVVAIARTRRP